jgi:hypothetical protein
MFGRLFVCVHTRLFAAKIVSRPNALGQFMVPFFQRLDINGIEGVVGVLYREGFRIKLPNPFSLLLLFS